ncbi:MAG: ATP-binding protein [Bacteroidetes bacterium]|nr:ATP-binding protein [Bacteroidota bacterium]
MAQIKYLTALIRAHVEGDETTFRRLVLQLASIEASAGHSHAAQQIREVLDQSTTKVLGQQTGKPIPYVNSPGTRVDLSGLLHASNREERLGDIVLAPATRHTLERVLEEWRNSSLLESHSLRKRNKLLLVGPPGCGKTFSARVLAGELHLPLFVVRLDGLISRFLGETANHLRNIFEAMQLTPGVYLFDEFDAIGTNRGEGRDVGEIRRVLSAFLLLLENFAGNSLIIAATNYKDLLDHALFRRFDDVIEYPLPSPHDLESLFKLKVSGFVHAPIEFPELAKLATGMSYADATKCVMEAMKNTVIAKKSKLTESSIVNAILERKGLKSQEQYPSS